MTYQWRRGKVRDMLQLSDNLLALVQSTRQSAFDRHICDIPFKGHVLTELAAWWFQKIEEAKICKTHYLVHRHNIMFAKPCTVIPLEIIVRGYITGNTSTSMWTNYKNGMREYCGVKLEENYVKNQKLSAPVITPTTKGEKDELISPTQIVEQGYMTQEVWDVIADTAMKLFEFGVAEAAKKGLILVDTKYEFGYDSDGNLTLIDEVHTCDSSRYWIADAYDDCMANGVEPKKYDKDIVRYWLKENPDETIPDSLIEKTSITYVEFYERLCEKKLHHYHFLDVNNTNPRWDSPEQELREIACGIFNSCIIICGSVKDMEHCQSIANNLNQNIIYNIYPCSAHKETEKLIKLLKRVRVYESCVLVTVAGMSNALSGVVACNTRLPVIACPPFKDKMDMMVNINSSLQCPSKVPVMTVLSPSNAAECVLRMLSLN